MASAVAPSVPTCVHVIHPCALRLPGIDEWRAEVEQVLADDQIGCSVAWVCMDSTNGFQARDFLSSLAHRPGPVLIFDCAQTKPLGIVREALLYRNIVCSVFPSDSTELWQQVVALRDRHLKGEPTVPRKFAVAILMVRKLLKRNYWGGKNKKNCLWATELAKGRGLSEDFADVAAEVANVLYLHGIFMPKYGGGAGKNQKYFLNSNRRQEIDRIAYRSIFPDRLKEILLKDHSSVSVRVLDWKAEPLYEKSIITEELSSPAKNRTTKEPA